MDEFIKKIVNVTISELNPDPLSIFYQKRVVITGTLVQLDRADAERILKQIGAIVTKAVSSKTDILVVGRQDAYKLVGPVSSKEKAASDFNAKGANIKIMYEDEDEFYHHIALSVEGF
jgi:NAD-dependent DNA ligase